MDPRMVASVIIKKFLENKNNMINDQTVVISIHHLPTTARVGSRSGSVICP